MAGYLQIKVLQFDFYLENSRLDPNDPRNAKLLLLLDSLPNSSEQANYFQLVDVENVQKYLPEDQFYTDKRFTMLCMRDQGVSSMMFDKAL